LVSRGNESPALFDWVKDLEWTSQMIHQQRVVVVLPAYNAAKTLERTHREIPMEVVDEVILVDDASQDETVALARSLGIAVIVHDHNRGYGANQKTCYREALERGADIIIMLHPDYQYSPKLITAIASMLGVGLYDLVLGSRILGVGARAGGMPRYKYLANRVLTFIENLVLGLKLSEYHTGYRGFTRQVLMQLPLGENSDDFVFDNEVLAQAAVFGYRFGEVSCPAHYFPEASSINFRRSVVYGLGVLSTCVRVLLHRWGFWTFPLFSDTGRKLWKGS
jgi:glycosyltransferase involved in cell wall biosynthesis